VGKSLAETLELLEEAIALKAEYESQVDLAPLEKAVESVLMEGKSLKKDEREELIDNISMLSEWYLIGASATALKDIVVGAVSEGVRRGYSVAQMWAGYPVEAYAGVQRLISDWGSSKDSQSDER
jgi:hypothetical protein